MRINRGAAVARFSGTQNRVTVKKYERCDRVTSLCCALFIAGVAAGALLCAFAQDSLLMEYIGYLVRVSLFEKAGGGFGASFFSALLSGTGWLGVFILYTASAFGAPLALGTLLLSGVGVGLTSGCVYTIFGVKGALVNLLVLLPADLLFAAACVLMARTACCAGAQIYAILYKNAVVNFEPTRQQIVYRAAASFLFIVVCALVRAACFLIFRGFFA